MVVLAGKISPLQPLRAFLTLASPLLPAVALVILVSRHLRRADGPMFLALAIIIAVAVALGVLALSNNIRHRDEVEPRVARITGWLHILPSVILLVFAVQATATDRSPDLQVWMIALFGADNLIGALHLIVTPRPKNPGAARKAREKALWRNAMATLTPADRTLVREELEDAVGVLLSRGFIDAADADRARSAPLGLLAVTVTSSAEGPVLL